MGNEREERLAKNEALFRVANERMAAWEDQHKAGVWEEGAGEEKPEPYFCECANPDCQEKVVLQRSEYEAVRKNSRHFFVIPGHEVPDVEEVIASHDGWIVIEKCPEVTETVVATDPRAG